MKCPVCESQVLRQVSVKGSSIKLSHCASCKGVWADRAKLAGVLGRRIAEKLAIPVYATRSSRCCPSCNQPLSGFFYPGTEIEVDGCAGCDGFWLDFREVNAIKQAERDSVQVECPRCHAENRYLAKNIDHVSCVSCGILLKNHFDAAGNEVVVPEREDTADASEEEEFEAYEMDAGWDSVPDLQKEYQYCLYAIPAMLFVAVLFNVTDTGAWMQRTWLGMPIHEFGHAVTAWLSGFAAIPTLWKTVTFSDSRGVVAPALVFAGICYLIYFAHRLESRPGLIFAISLLLVQFILTIVISNSTANMLITFGGDGMGMILATLLMATFYYGKYTNLYRGHLRWGFVVIGAAAFIDMYSVWVSALSNESNVPYGTTGGQYTDSYKLIEFYGWSFDTLINRYFMLGSVCLLALALVYYFGLRKAREMMKQEQSGAGERTLADHPV